MHTAFSQVEIDSITKINDDLIYSAKDSIVYDINKNRVLLYNEAKLTYKNIQLESGFMLINFNNNTILSTGLNDSFNN